MTSFTTAANRLALALLGLGMIAATGPAVAGNNWNPQHILLALKYPYSHSSAGNVVTIAHRGVSSPGCPENSRCAILNAYNDGVEAIELDVKQSAEGTPWLFHDQNAGRMLNHNPPFYIFQNGNPSGWNPDIRSLHDWELPRYTLRDKNFNNTGYHPVSVADALWIVKSQANHMVVVFDIKTADAVQKIASMVVSRGMQNQVVLKFSASLFANNPGSIPNYTKGVAFAPTVYAGDMDSIVDSGFIGTCPRWGLSNYMCRIESWVDQAAGMQNYAWIEVGNKVPVQGDPTLPLLNYLRGKKRAIGAFSPVPEYRTSYGDGAYYVRSNATCCAKLSDYYTSSKYFGRETGDNRPDVDTQIFHGFTSVISDDPAGVNRVTGRYGRRNTSLYN